MSFASSRKDVGGKLFKAGRYSMALDRYKGVVETMRSSEELPEGGAELMRICHLNMAACMLKLADANGADDACTKVLLDEPENIKALFRRASARIALESFSEACSDLR